MYEYERKSMGSLGADTYTPAGTHTLPGGVPYSGIVNVDMGGVKCRCYHNAPREVILRSRVPYAMEISLPDHAFICSCNPSSICPESVHQGIDKRDPWRQRRCAEWFENYEQEVAQTISSEQFRSDMTERVLDVSGITGAGRAFAQPAEFVQVLAEREQRSRAVTIASIVVLALGGGVLTWKFVADRKRESEQEQL